MVDLVLGIAAAVGASTLYSLGIALQAMDAKEAPARGAPAPGARAGGLLRRGALAARHGRCRSSAGRCRSSRCCWPRWWSCSRRSPPGCSCCCCSAERMLGEHAGRYEHVAMCAIVLGVVGAALSAPPRSDHAHVRGPDDHAGAPSAWRSRACFPTCCARSAARTAERHDDRRRPRLRLERGGDQARLRRPRLGTPSAGGRPCGRCPRPPPRRVGVLSEMSALQARPAIQVAPVVFVTQTVVPVVLAPLLFGERFGDDAARRRAAGASRWRCWSPARRCSRARRCCACWAVPR